MVDRGIEHPIQYVRCERLLGAGRELESVDKHDAVFLSQNRGRASPAFQSVDRAAANAKISHAPWQLANDVFLNLPSSPVLALNKRLYAVLDCFQVDASIGLGPALPYYLRASRTRRAAGKSGRALCDVHRSEEKRLLRLPQRGGDTLRGQLPEIWKIKRRMAGLSKEPRGWPQRGSRD